MDEINKGGRQEKGEIENQMEKGKRKNWEIGRENKKLEKNSNEK